MSVTFLKPCQNSLNMAVSAALLGCERRLWQLSFFYDWFGSSGQTNIGPKRPVGWSSRAGSSKWCLTGWDVFYVCTSVVSNRDLRGHSDDETSDGQIDRCHCFFFYFWSTRLQDVQIKKLSNHAPDCWETLLLFWKKNIAFTKWLKWHFTLSQYKVTSFIFLL